MQELKTEIAPGSKVTGKVVDKLDFGLIVSIADGAATGFVHVSELVGASKEERDKLLENANLSDVLELDV